ncbi:MAG: alanyl-tRNA editing protein [Anaerolineae bacterium]|nr:alanyl-tRNA editing protein [Anaerolineae bacterium]
MTTTRLYYADSYTTTFDAHLIERATYGNAPAVVLDRTYFYPTSGGQPHDTGALNDVPVVDVVIRPDDGAVLHVVAGEVSGETVSGQIDWTRRFDHMRHHTGQHILSQAFVRLARAETVGFHLSPDSVTIDLSRAVKPATIDAAEDLANQVVAENRPVRAWFPTADELSSLQLRKVPEVDGKLRIVAINDFDVTACGGTHVAHTGEVGVIKVLRVDRRGDTVRVEFRCGARALLDYRQKNALMNQLAAELTTGIEDIPAALQRLRDENKALRRDLRALQSTMIEYEAGSLWQAADRAGGYALIAQVFEHDDAGRVRQLVQDLIARPGTIAVCGIAGEKAQFIAARSDDLPHDMVAVLKRGLAVWGVDRGGGRPSFAQGGGAAATPDDVRAALAAAIEAIRLQDG